MKFRKWGQTLLAATVSAGVGLGLTSCGQSSIIDYLYLTSAFNSPGQIDAYRVDSQTGALSELSATPFTAGVDPVALVPSPNGENLYVVNRNDNSVIAYTVNADATLSGATTYNTPGSQPVAAAVNPAGTFLFVVDQYAPSFSAQNPGPGALTVYPISSTGALGAAVTQTSGASYYALGTAPTAVNVLAGGNTVYVADQLTGPAAGCSTGQGAIVALSISSSGVLTPVGGSPFCAGVAPSSIASHPIGHFLYVTDSSQNQLLGYVIDTAGALQPLVGGPVATGVAPSSVVVDPRGLYIYVAAHGSDAVYGYSIAQNTGIPSSTGNYRTGAFPECVIVEPALGRFVYTADFEGFGITGYQLDPNTGTLTGTENSPYGGSGLQTCLAAVAHGNHPIINPQGTAANP